MNLKHLKLKFCIKTLILAALMMSTAAADDAAPSIDMQEGTVYTGFLRQMNGYVFYSLKVPDNYPQGEDLAVIVIPTQLGADPDVFISTTKSQPKNPQEADAACIRYGYDICILDSNSIKPNSTIYVTVFCNFWCDFNVSAQFSEYMTVTAPKDDVVIHLGSTGMKQVKVSVPQDDTSDHIIFSVNYVDFKNAKSTLDMYGNQGDIDPSTSAYTLAGISSWNEGKTISLSQKGGPFCTNCTFSILLHGDPGSNIRFSARLSHSRNAITLNQRNDETLGYDGVIYYELQLSQEQLKELAEETLNFEIIPYTGNPDLFVGDEYRSDLKEYRWNSSSVVGESLTLTPEERSNTTSVYHIAISSARASTFSFIVYPTGKNLKKIHFGTSETGYVNSGEVVSFILDVPTQEADLKIMSSLHSVSGNSDLFIKKCAPAQNDCKITQEDVQNGANLIAEGKLFVSRLDRDEDKISFVQKPGDCQIEKESDPNSACRYAVGVLGSSTSSSNYELVLYYQEKHIILRDQIPFKNTLDIGEQAHYKFTVADDEFVNAIVFQLTPISGSPQLYSSKTIYYPTISPGGYDKAACQCSHMIVYCGRSALDIPLKSTYFLTVHAFTHSMYTITAYIMTMHRKSILELHQNMPQRFAYRNVSEPAYFQIKLSSVKDDALKISLSPINGRFKMYLGVDSVPNANDPSTYIKESDTNSIIVDTDDLKSSQKDSLYVTVVLLNASDIDENASKQQFNIIYSTKAGITTLQEGQPHTIKLTKKETRYFKITASSSDELVKFVATVFSGDVDMYVSADSKNKYPDSTNPDFTTTRRSPHVVSISREQLKSKRGDAPESSDRQLLYLAVVPLGEDDAEITLAVVKNETKIPVQDGVPFGFLLSQDENPIYFFAHSNKQTFSISITSEHNITAYASIMDMTDTPLIQDWVFPNETNGVPLRQISVNDYYAEIDPKDCSECMLGITIKNRSPAPQHSKASILVTTSSRKLQTGTILVDLVEPFSYKQYNFELTSIDQDAAIYLTPFSSRTPELLLSQGSASLVTGSTKIHWSSRDVIAPSIEVSKNTLPSDLNNTRGHYNLAVYNNNSTTCSYSLLFSSRSIKLSDLKAGIAQELNLSPLQSNTYLRYLYNGTSVLKVMIARDVGDTDLYATVLPSSSENSADGAKSNSLPSPNNSNYSTQNIHTKNLLYISPVGEKGDITELLINVQNNEKVQNSKLSVIINSQDQFTQLYIGKTFRDFVNSSSSSKYAYTGSRLKNEEMELTLTVYSGNPILVASRRTSVSPTDYEWAQDALFYNEKDRSSSGTKVLSLKIFRGTVQGSSSNYTIQEHDDLFFLVHSTKDSLYDITFKAADKFTVLQSGRFVEGSLEANQEQSFFFFASDSKLSGNNDQFTVSVSTKESQQTPALTVIHTSDPSHNADSDTDVLEIFDVKTVGQSKIFYYDKKNGTYNVVLKNNEKTSVQYSLLFNFDDRHYLPLNTPVFASIAKDRAQEAQEYVIYIDRKGKVLIELYNCYGLVTLALRKESKVDQTSKSQNERQDLLTPNNIYKIYDVEEGYYTAQVKLRSAESLVRKGNSTPTAEAGYKIIAMFLDESIKPPHDNLSPGQKGILKWSANPNDGLDFKWEEVFVDPQMLRSKKEGGKNNLDISYEMVVSNNRVYLNMYAKCGIQSFEAFSVGTTPLVIKMNASKSEAGSEVQSSFGLGKYVNNKTLDDVMYATVIASVGPNFGEDYQDYHSKVPVFYQTIEIPVTQVWSPSHKGFMVIIIACVMAVILIALFVLRYYRSKTIKTEQRLQYEMTYARNNYGNVRSDLEFDATRSSEDSNFHFEASDDKIQA